MGHKVITTNNTMSYTSHSQRRRATLTILAVTLAATCCDSFTTSTPFFASASPHKNSRTPFAPPKASATIDAATTLPNFIPEAVKNVPRSSWIPRPLLRRRAREEEDCERRKREWAATYTSVKSLREKFGSNTKLWGDLDASSTRRLYKTLLPRALLELYRLGLQPEDLAPLAYKARVAAKLYARERCSVPARLWAMGFDGLRAWKKYNKFQVTGMSYDQVWEKYESEIMQEIQHCTEGLTEEDVTAKICLRILERSCTTNEGVDKLFLRESDAKAMEEQQQDISDITQQLEKDVRAILDPLHKTQPNAMTAQRVRTLRMVVRAKRRMERLKLLEDEKKRRAQDQDDIMKVGNVIHYPWQARSSKMHDRAKPFENREFPSRSQR